MISDSSTHMQVPRPDAALGLYRLLDPEILHNPYPLCHRLRTEDPVCWDPFLKAWVVTRYDDTGQETALWVGLTECGVVWSLQGVAAEEWWKNYRAE